jgi:WD40 repeat protein
MRKTFYFLVFIVIFLQGCSTTSTGSVTEPARQSEPPGLTLAVESELAAASPSPAPTLTSVPTSTSLPTQAAAPTQAPEPTATLLPPAGQPLGSQPIGWENAAQIAELAALGRGSVLRWDRLAQGSVLVVLTPLGLYHLDPESLAQIAFQGEAQEYAVLPGRERLLVRYPEGRLAVVRAVDGVEDFRMAYEVNIPWNYEAWLERLPEAARAAQRELLRRELLAVQALAVSADQSVLAVATGDAHIRLWSMRDGALVHDLYHDLVTDVEQMAFSPDGSKLVVVERSRDMGMWDLTQPKLLWHHKEVGHINGQPFSPDGKLLAAEISSYISADAWVVLLHADFGDVLGRITGARVSGNPFSADSRHLAVFWYERVKLYLTTNMAYVQKIDTGVDIHSVSFAPDGTHLLVNEGELAYASPDYAPVDAAAFRTAPAPVYDDPTAELRAQGYYTGLQGVVPLEGEALRAWGKLGESEFYWFDLPAGEINWMMLPEVPANTPLFAADGSAVFYCNAARLFVVPVYGAGARDLGRCSTRAVLAYAPLTGILARGQGTTLDLIDVQSGEIVHNLLGHAKQLTGLKFSEDGSLLASGSSDLGSRGFGEVAIWTTEPAHNLVLDRQRPWGVDELVYSPDNRWLAFYNNGNLHVWSVEERRLYAYFDSQAVQFAFSPDSRLLAVGNRDGTLELHEVPSGKLLSVLQAARGVVTGLTFTPDQALLVVTAADGIIRLVGVK